MISFDEYKEVEIPLPHDHLSFNNKTHIGMVLLGSEHSLDYEWSKLLSDDTLTFSTRVAFDGNLSTDNLANIQDRISNATNLIATGLEMDVMLFACTSASIVIGEEQIHKVLCHNRGNIPATNPWTAAKAAFEHLKAKNIAVLCPYPATINYLLYNQLINSGFNASAIASFGIENDKYVTTLSKDTLKNAIDKLLTYSKPDLIFMSCTNLRILDDIQEFEESFNIPIISSNTALFWHALQLIGKKPQLKNYGKLLSGC